MQRQGREGVAAVEVEVKQDLSPESETRSVVREQRRDASCASIQPLIKPA